MESRNRQDFHMTGKFPHPGLIGLLVLLLAGIAWGSVALAAEIPARIGWSQRVEMGTPVSGVIRLINAVPGQRVRQGEVLLQLDQRGLRASVESHVAELKKLESILAEAGRELERAEVMYERTLLSDHELQVKKNEYVAARANRDMGKAALTRARLDLEYSEIRAPFDAIVVARQAEVGQTVVSLMQPPVLLVVAEARRRQANGFLDARQAATVRPGQKATVKVNGQAYAGEVTAISPEPAPGRDKAARYPVSVTFATGEEEIPVGVAATIELQ